MKQIDTLTLVLIFTLIHSLLYSQDLLWVAPIGSSGADYGYGTHFGPSGEVLTIGYFEGTVDFNPGAGTNSLTSSGNRDVYIQKLDANGNYVWAHAFGSTSVDEGFGVSVDASGNVYASGYFQGTVDFDPGVGTMNISAVGNKDIFVLKLDANGNLLWVHAFGSGQEDVSYALATDAANNVYLTGGFSSTIDFDPGAGVNNLTSNGSRDVFVLKLDANGNYIWAKSFGGNATYDYGRGIAVDAAGNVITTGDYVGNVDFDPGIGTDFINSSSTDAFISKLDANGNYVWAGKLGGSSTDYGRGIATDAAGNIYTCGYYWASGDFDLGPAVLTLNAGTGSYSAYTCKYDPNGNYIWGHTHDGLNYACRVNASNVYVAGTFNNTVDFDFGTGIDNKTSVGSLDVQVHAMRLDGTHDWVNTVGSTGGDRALGLDADENGNVVATGIFTGTADFDPSVGTTNLTSVGAVDAFVTKYISCNIPTDNALYWTENSTALIQNYDLQTMTQNLVASGITSASGIAVDSITNTIYWVSTSGNMIQKQDLPCGAITTIASGLSSPRDIELDLRKGKVYWTELSAGIVKRANLDGSNVETLISGLNQPLGLDLDLTNDKIYTVVLNAGPSFILQSDLDGSNQITLVNSTDARDVVVDAANNKMYWTSGSLASISEATLTGTGVATLVAGLNGPYGITLDESTGTLYFAQSSGSIRSVSTAGTGLTDLATGLGLSLFVALPNTEEPMPSTALDFDGTNDYVHLPDLDFSASDEMSIEAWIRPTDITSKTFVEIIRQEGAFGGDFNWFLSFQLNGTRLAFRVKNVGGTGVALNVPITPADYENQWNHIAAVYDGTDLRLYLNGVLIGTPVAQTGNIRHSNNLNTALGAFKVGAAISENFEGTMDEVRLWNRALCEGEIIANKDCELTGGESGLVLYYNMNQGMVCQDNATETTAIDRSSNGNDGTLTNFALSGEVSNWSDGSGNGVSGICNTMPPSTLGNDKRGEMYTFDGVNDYIRVPYNAALDFGTGDFTFETWLKNDANNVTEAVFDYNNGADVGLHIFMANGQPLIDLQEAGGSNTSYSYRAPAITNNEWHHIAWVREGATIRIYVDGVEQVLSNTSNAITVGTTAGITTGYDLYIGTRINVAGLGWTGNMDEIRIWNKARTQAEIRENMHLSLTECPSNLVAYYQFDMDDAINTANGVKDVANAYDGTTFNMATTSRVASEVAVGAGYSDRVTITGAGTVSFPLTGVDMTFGATHPNGELVVTRIMTEAPTGWNSIGADVDDEYFVVRNYGTNNTFTTLTDISFNNIGYIDPADAATPSVFSLYKRGSADYGNTWGGGIGNAVTATAGSAGVIGFDNTTNITSFSQFVIGTPFAQASDLPVELLSFDAKRINSERVELDWSTAIEVNNQGFSIERMLAIEGEFETVGFVNGQGTIRQTTYYNFDDQNAYTGVSYYRLKQVDLDGTISYSPIRAVDGARVTTVVDNIQIYPNPINNILKVRFEEISKDVKAVNIHITNTIGQELIYYETPVESYQVLEIKDVEDLVPATYFLNLELDNGKIINHKFIKK